MHSTYFLPFNIQYRSLILERFISWPTSSGVRERRLIRISGSPIWSKTLVELIFNPCSEFRWSPEGRDSQIHSSHLQVGAPGIFSDLLRSVQMLKREWGAESYRTYTIPCKTVALIPGFAVEDLPSKELQPRLLRSQWRTCPWAEHSDDDDEYWIPNDW